MAKKKQFTWSYSALGTWEACPLQYRYTYLDQLPKPPNVYRDDGIRIHEECEAFFLKPRARKVPAELVKLTGYLTGLKAQGYHAETKVCFDREWRECDHGVRWGTVKLDLHQVLQDGTYLHVVDLKTGKPKDFSDQGRIYLAGMLARYPEVKKGHAEFAYSKTGEILSGRGYGTKMDVANSTQMRGYQRELTVRAKRMEADKRFKPKPGGACRWCDFSKHRGGPCKSG